jgi:lysophospholipase L1-like esterase
MRIHLPLLSYLLAIAAPAWSLNMAAIGDSITDEYLGYAAPITAGVTDLAARNWVQILAETRGDAVNFGALALDPNERGEPRGRGYAYNWARAGATATTPGLLGSFGLPDFTNLAQQAAGLRPTVASGAVSVVFSGIGSNDFLVRTGIFGTLPAQPLSGPDYDSWEDNLIASIFTPLDDLHAAGAEHILIGLIPGTADSGANANPALNAAIAHANARLIDGAAARGYRIVDWFGWADDPALHDADGNLLVGGLVIHPDAASAADLVPAGTPGAGACNSAGLCAGPDHALHITAEDGIHPNTIGQALIANAILGALNTELGLDIPLLTDREMVQLSGARVSAVPLPAAGWLFGGALLGLRGLRRRRAV